MISSYCCALFGDTSDVFNLLTIRESGPGLLPHMHIIINVNQSNSFMNFSARALIFRNILNPLLTVPTLIVDCVATDVEIEQRQGLGKMRIISGLDGLYARSPICEKKFSIFSFAVVVCIRDLYLHDIDI